MLLENQKKCNHEFQLLASAKKTIEGYYKDPRDYKKGERFNMYMCRKCSVISSVHYNENDITPVLEFEEKHTIVAGEFDDENFVTDEKRERARKR